MKTNASNLEISSIAEVWTSAGLESFRVPTEEPVDDQIYFRISDRDKNSSEQLRDDSQGISDSSQVNAVPPINTSI